VVVQIEMSLKGRPGLGGGKIYLAISKILFIFVLTKTNTEMKRKRGNDYLKEFNEIEKRKSSLYNHVIKRLEFLIDKYPLAKVDRGHEEARYLPSRFKSLIEGDIVWKLTTWEIIGFIIEIEQWSAKQQKVKQLKIDHIYNDAKDMMDATLKKLDD
jgi:hypothetical protein